MTAMTTVSTHSQSAITPTLTTEELMERFVGDMNASARLIMVSLGHRTGLFDMMSTMGPASAAQIASRAGLHERYVREWLGAMVTSRFVSYDPDQQTYHLPLSAAACLTRAAVPQNFASMGQWVSVLGAVEGQVLEAFKTGKGVPYCAYHRFHDVMAEESDQTVGAMLESAILPLEPGLINRLKSGIEVLDIGCGAGRSITKLARLFPESRFTGYDLSEEAVGMGNSNAQRQGLKNIQFIIKDATNIDDIQRFDLIFAFDAIHDQAYPDIVLANLHRALKDDGCFLMQDIYTSSYLENNMDHPLGTFLYTVSCTHCMSVSLAQGGVGLGACWGEELAQTMLKAAGFAKIEIYRLEHDIMNNYYVCHKG
jgi:SAM-dependent methyltransferase